MMKRIKRKIKRIIFQTHKNKEKRKDGKIKAIGDIPIFSVGELCSYLGIEIPNQYNGIRNRYVTETALFSRLENKKELISQITIRENFPKDFYNKFQKRSKSFKKIYYQIYDLKHTDQELLEMFVESQYVFWLKGFRGINYFSLELHRKSIAEAEKFINTSYSGHINKTCNRGIQRKYCTNKLLFNKKYTDYVKRDFLYPMESTFEEFKAFCIKHPKLFAKPIEIGQGAGIRIIEVKNNIEEIFNECKDEKLIIEEIVVQHPEMAAFNSSGVNTLRICTLLKADGNPLVTNATIRISRAGSIMSNGGLQAAIDIKTGKVTTNGFNKKREPFEVHPDSGKRFKDFQVPLWDEVIKATTESAKMLPNVRHIGWDIAITADDNVEFIEGNTDPSATFANQTEDQIGKKHIYEKHLPDIERYFQNHAPK